MTKTGFRHSVEKGFVARGFWCGRCCLYPSAYELMGLRPPVLSVWTFTIVLIKSSTVH